MERCNDRKDFVILGYSFGCVVAIELVRLLENEGFSGRLICVDGAPEQLLAMKNQTLSSTITEEFQDKILITFMDLVDPMLSSEVNIYY